MPETDFAHFSGKGNPNRVVNPFSIVSIQETKRGEIEYSLFNGDRLLVDDGESLEVHAGRWRKKFKAWLNEIGRREDETSD